MVRKSMLHVVAYFQGQRLISSRCLETTFTSLQSAVDNISFYDGPGMLAYGSYLQSLKQFKV